MTNEQKTTTETTINEKMFVYFAFQAVLSAISRLRSNENCVVDAHTLANEPTYKEESETARSE